MKKYTNVQDTVLNVTVMNYVCYEALKMVQSNKKISYGTIQNDWLIDWFQDI